MAALLNEGRLQLTITDSGAGFVTGADGAGITDIRERLDALYGGKANLALRTRESGGTEAVMEIPVESVRAG